MEQLCLHAVHDYRLQDCLSSATGLPLGSDRRSCLVSSGSARSARHSHHTAAPHEPGRCASYKQKTNKLCIKWKTALKVVSVGGHGFARILWAASLRQASANSPQRPGGEVGEVDSGPERSRGEPSAPEARGQCVGVDNSEYNNYYCQRSRSFVRPTYDSTSLLLSQFKIIFCNPTCTS